MPRILKPEVERSLAEIPQTIETKFSYATILGDGNIQRHHEWVKCRDFLGDVLYANRYESEVSIYNFKASPQRTPVIPGQVFHLLVKFPSPAIRDTFIKNFTMIVNTYEIFNDISYTTYKKLRGALLLTCGGFWSRNTVAMSFFTYLLKVCCYEWNNPADWVTEFKDKYMTSVERSYTVNSPITKIMKHLKTIVMSSDSITGWEHENSANISNIHNSSGFYSLFRMRQNNNWYSSLFFSLGD